MRPHRLRGAAAALAGVCLALGLEVGASLDMR
jgi:hypothetical protein